MALILNYNRNLVISIGLKLQSQTIPLVARSFATHWDPKFRKLRGQKVVKVNIIHMKSVISLFIKIRLFEMILFEIKPKLPEFDKIKLGNDKSETKEEERARRIKEGFEPPVGFEYKPLNFSSSSFLFLLT